MYINCHTYYSLKYGTFSEVDLLKLASENGVQSLVLTDINNTSACLNFIRLAKEYNIKPIVGIDFRNGVCQQFVGVAKNNNGFQELNKYLSKHSHNKIPFEERAPVFLDSYIIYPFEKALENEIKDFKTNEFIGVSVHELNKLRFSYLRNFEDKLIIQQTVTVRNKRDFNAHRLLRAIDKNTVLSKLHKSEECLFENQMIPIEKLESHFEEFPNIIKNTKQLLSSCEIKFQFGKERVSQNQDVYLNSEKEDYELLLKLCNEGLRKRYPNPTPKVKERLNKELKTIKELNYIAFFLINYDIVRYAKSQGYFHVGRGSGANSIIAYIIGITNVDPIELDLYFERFINPFRASPPDFDIDFSWKDREDVTRYIFERFKHTALLATYNTFKFKGVTRELGKVFGLPKAEIDKLCTGKVSHENLDDVSSLVIKYGKLIEGFPNHLSIHAAGILILNKPVHYYSGTDLPPKGFPTVQYDMIIAEDVGIFKFDILGQRGLAKIKETLELIAENQPDKPPVDIENIECFKQDKNINNLLKTGGAIGAYYVESPAMRGLMQKLKTNDYLGLVAASSIIRPGVSGSGMKLEFIRREKDPERRKLANPILLKIMPETHGIMVYQEDVLKVANQFAGLTLGEADVLRRGMSGKFRSRTEFKEVEQKFIKNCQAKGYTNELIFEVWDQIKSFAGYAFAKGHSASYAVESYQTLYLKYYYPVEFMTAVLNNGGGFYNTAHYIHEARMCGANICLPCVNISNHGNRAFGNSIYLGFGYLKNIENITVQRLLNERNFNGAYTSLDNFIDRVSISIEQLTILVRINAFRFTGITKQELLWNSIFKINANRKRTTQSKLFALEHKNYVLPKFKTSWIENAYDELELLGFPLCSFFKLIAHDISDGLFAENMLDYDKKAMLIYGELVTTRYNKTSKGQLMRLSTFIDSKGKYFDVVHFSDTVNKYPINGMGVYGCYGTISKQFDFCSMTTIWTKKISVFKDPRG